MAEGDKQFEVTTTAQIERTYRVTAQDGDAAHERLRRYLADPEMAAPGVVEKQHEHDSTSERVQTATIKEMTGPKPVETSAKEKTA